MNFRYIIKIALVCLMVLLPAALLTGCADEPGLQIPEGEECGAVIRFYSAGADSRADAQEDSDSKLNEDRIGNLYVAFYPSVAYEGTTKAVRVECFRNLDASGSTEQVVSLRTKDVEALFGTAVAEKSECQLYVIANLTEDEINRLGNEPTIAQMKALVVESEFGSRQVQESFVMTGDATVNCKSDGKGNFNASGSVALTRRAAKIQLNIKLPEYVEGLDGSRWQPLSSPATGAMRVLLNNGVAKSAVVPDGKSLPAADAYFNITTHEATYGFEDNRTGNPDYPNRQRIPFYTYPNRWENSPNERRRTSMVLLVPWHNVTTDVYQTFYYTVPVTPADMPELVANHSYQIDLNVGMLGSTAPETPLEIEGQYRVADWAQEQIDVDIKDYRYLVVSQSRYVVDNTSTAAITFYSSHPVEVQDISLTYNRYAFVSSTGTRADRGKVVSFTVSKDQIEASNTEADKFCTWDIRYSEVSKLYTVAVTHPLKMWIPVDSSGKEVSLTGYSNADESTVDGVKNRIVKYLPTQEDAYSPYTIDVTLCHSDKRSFVGSFTIVQNPGMYVEAVPNPGGEYMNRYGTTTNYGYSFVNPTIGTISSGANRGKKYYTNDSSLGSLSVITSSGNNGNPNMYIINVTTLDSESEFIIGDPRALYINNQMDGTERTSDDTQAAGSWCTSAPALYYKAGTSGDRKLQFYYPTSELESKKNMMAPRFRVASSYAEMSGTVNKEGARKRCATYQEQGCPAGRWRIPTYAELKFIVWLGQTGKIPRLFNDGGTYWTAQGLYTIKADGSLEASSSTSSFVRPIYDEWYWEKEGKYLLKPNADGGYDFTWGDMPKGNPQN
ncbi:MAG: hypothetical protein K2G78_03295 [Muribaculaceae bacterium]|nr:hypothetical protein [Muribaculaceae bacterium]